MHITYLYLLLTSIITSWIVPCGTKYIDKWHVFINIKIVLKPSLKYQSGLWIENGYYIELNK